MILGMGKLGGNELNYSSDLDLIFIHDNEPLTGDTERDYKLRMKAARILIEVMSEVTDEGFLARWICDCAQEESVHLWFSP